ncbi:PR-1 [Lecanosticta acicola]|uniref:PR-1 n=1 Tax=Lecanosticta acicola TaxID=111012 RepID=A0AAI8Z2U3_9PEZI|nr:PR-1 [Lecanosticta acicola]
MFFATILTALVAATATNAVRDSRSRLHRQSKRDVDFVDMVVTHHNIHRANHSATPIFYHYDMSNTARKIAQSCNFSHNMEMDGGGYGQNIAAGVPWQNISAVITDLWYNNEVEYFNGQYGKQTPDTSQFEKFGHFSQMVWNATTHVGCYTQHCPNGVVNAEGTNDFTVCNYLGAGNVDGEWADNVMEPEGHPTYQWNYGMNSTN